MRRIGFIVIANFVIVAVAAASTDFTLVEAGAPKATVVIRQDAGPLERRAADELIRYVKEITGGELAMLVGDDLQSVDGDCILVGELGKHPAVRKLGDRGLISWPPDTLTSDTFLIRTVRDGDRKYLLLGGAEGPGILYAVYHLLENFCGVGFFWDTEVVPRSASITLPALNLVETPFFRERGIFQYCAFFETGFPKYSAFFWSFDDFKRELDWCVKKKLNTVYIPLGEKEIYRRLYKRLGVPVAEPTPWEKRDADLAVKVVEYARSLGLKVLLDITHAGVTDDFRAHYPDVRYIEFHFEAYTSLIHSEDPMFEKFVMMYLEEATGMLGNDHLFESDPYRENPPWGTLDEKWALKTAFAKKTCEVIRRFDPEAVWSMGGWDIVYQPNIWTEEWTKRFCDSLVRGAVTIRTLWGDRFPVYEKHNYFYGHNWGFGVLHAFAGNDGLFGDVGFLIGELKKIQAEPKASGCTTFWLEPEIVHYNPFYHDLALTLSWNPKAFDLDSFVTSYAERRYGRSTGREMEEVLRKLLRSVYGEKSQFYQPPYRQRLTTWFDISTIDSRLHYPQELGGALEVALKHATELKDNSAYRNDLLEVTHQYILNTVSYHIASLYSAFRDGDKEAFAEKKGIVNKCMDSLEGLYQSHPDYWIKPVEDQALSADATPGWGAFAWGGWPVWGGDRTDSRQTLRRGYVFLGGYASVDLYETVKFYFRPLLDNYIDHLQGKIDRGEFSLQDSDVEQLNRQYDKVVESWLNRDFSESVYPKKTNVVETVKAISSRLRFLWQSPLQPLRGR